ncbi:MAG: 2-oxo acid dehydrogenase subunit E2 [Promethearchaeota archaeon]
MESESNHVIDQSEEANKRVKKRHLELNSTTELIIDDPRGYKIEKVSNLARLLHEFTTFGKEKNTIWAFCSTDVTDALRMLKEHKKQTGESISFTAFLITVFARVVAYHKNPMNALMRKKKELYIFNDVDVMTNIERTLADGSKKPISYTIRKANEKTLRQISDELREAQKEKKITATSTGKKSGKKRWIKWVVKRMPDLPRWIRHALLKWMFSKPQLKKNAMGTANVTAVGMFGSGLGYMIHLTPHALSLGVGGMDNVPFTVDGVVMSRKMLGLTLAMDHDIIDGGPAARFFHDLRQWLMFFCHDADWCFKSLENADKKSE